MIKVLKFIKLLSRRAKKFTKNEYYKIICYDPDVEDICTTTIADENRENIRYCGSPVIANRQVRRKFMKEEHIN